MGKSIILFALTLSLSFLKSYACGADDRFKVLSNVACEDTCTHIHGIDMSHYQGDIFWEKIGENSKMAYVYLKATEADNNIDDRYEHNIKMAQKYGLKVGSYHFFRPRKELRQQLDNFMSQCRPEEQDLVPMIDVETKSKMNTEAFCDSLLKFLDMVEEAYGQKPLVYTYRNFYNKYLQGRIDEYNLMVAQYTDYEPVLADGRDFIIWQYTAKGRINGVNTFVDKSRIMGRHSLREIRYHHKNKPRKTKKPGENGWMVIPDPEA